MELLDHDLATSDDYLWKTLVLDCPSSVEPVVARIRVTQPHGFIQEFESRDVRIEAGRAHVRMLYPLIDEGRYEPAHGSWNGAWEMGEYRFEVTLHAGARTVAEDVLSLDPHDLFPSDRMVISVDARPQIIECATRQMLYAVENEAELMIRIRRHRVPGCHVEVDVTAREDEQRLAGPWQWRLDHQWRRQSFDIRSWSTGEYRLRIRVLVDGAPIGPWCIRRFWKQVETLTPPETITLAGYPEVLVDDWSFTQVDDIRFVPDAMTKRPDPVVAATESHEEEMLAVRSIEWNERQRRYECEYGNIGGRRERTDTAAERAHLRMLLISDDGERWSKPRLGLVAYDGSTDNNILRDDTDHPSEKDLERDHDIEHAQFRFYDPQTDGPVNIDNVFVASGKRHFPFQCKSLQREGAGADAMAKAEAGQAKDLRDDGLGVMQSEDEGADDPDAFRPQGGEHWPFEKRGDLYLVLTREPLFYLGVGMDLMHTTESIRCHVEETDRKRLLYYFRPGAPAYPPHGAVYDNMHLGLRCMGVVWTDDGLTYHRQFVLAPDGLDPIGSQFYAMGLIQKAETLGDAPGRPVLDKCLSKINQAFPMRNLYLGTTLLHWGIEQTQAPELIWTRDLLHFRRFRAQRQSLIENGTGGTFDHGMIRDQYKYRQFDGEWWYHYTGVNTRHNGYGVMARHESIETYREKFSNHGDAPYFDTWEGCWTDGKQTKYLPGIARCKPYRVAHAEPDDVRGTLTTRPVRVDGAELRINAMTQPGGFIEVEIIDEDGAAVLAEPFRFEGDEVAAAVADLRSRADRLITIRFALERARLYAFEIAK